MQIRIEGGATSRVHAPEISSTSPSSGALDAVQDGEQRIEVHGWEGPTRPIEALYNRMRSATGVELDPSGSLALHEFRWPAADHELGQDAQGHQARR